jgi:hypothetical protein
MCGIENQTSFKQFREQAVMSTAYHESGHMVAAVVLGLPLLDGGIHIDLELSGVSYYCHRLPGDPSKSRQDQLEREKTVIALYAGRIAQLRFLPDYDDPASWESDRAIATQLLAELEQGSPRASEGSLWHQAESLVASNWRFIEGLASALLAKPITAMSQDELEKGWSKGTRKQEKCMSHAEVSDFFRREVVGQ